VLSVFSHNSYLHTLLPPERNNEAISKLHKPLNIQFPTPEQKDVSPHLNMTGTLSK